MTRKEAVAITAHDDLVMAAITMRRMLAAMANRTISPGTPGVRADIVATIEIADRALAMAGVTFDASGKVCAHAA